jgi:hypothetical protein
MQSLKLFILVLLLCTTCSCKDKQDKSPKADIVFDRQKWDIREGFNYTYRSQMVNDLLKNHQWIGMTKDSLVLKLGKPNTIEVDRVYLYYYKDESLLGGAMSSHKAISFEIDPGTNQVKEVELGEGMNWNF